MAKYPLPKNWRERVVSHARGMAWGKVELTPNRGQYCDHVTSRAGGSLGEYWCMDLAVTVFLDVLQLACPLLKSGSCEQQRQRAIAKGALVKRAEFDRLRATDPELVAGFVGLVIGKDDAGNPHAHHAVIVGDLNDAAEVVVNGPHGGFLTNEGNAADPKATASRNGDGAYHGRERGTANDTSEYEFIDPVKLAA